MVILVAILMVIERIDQFVFGPCEAEAIVSASKAKAIEIQYRSGINLHR